MAKTFGEVGDIGLVRWYGMVESRFIKDLYGTDGITAFEEMFRRDPTLRAFTYAVKMMSRTSTWRVITASEELADMEAAEFLDSCIEDMSHTMSDFIDNALSMLVHGWSWFEICYKRRSGGDAKNPSDFEDGRIGWRKFAPRKQTSWYRWEFDDAGGVAGMWQWPQGERMAGQTILLPIEKSLHFKTDPAQGDPEGISLGEACYELWYFLKNLLPIMGIGFERSFVGLPTFHWEKDVTPDDTDVAAVANMGKGLRMGEKAYAAIPAKIREFDLKSVANPVAGDMLNTIQYFRQLMLQSVLSEFLTLGVGGTGTYAAHRDKTDLFLMAVDGFLSIISAVLNRFAVPRLFGYNEFPGMTSLPTLQHTRPNKPNLPELGQFIQAIAQYMDMAEEDWIWLRDQAGMPILEEDEAEEETPEPETGEEDDATQGNEPPPVEEGDEMSGVGKALAEFAEAPRPGPFAGTVAQILAERQAKLAEKLAKKQADPGDKYWEEEEQALVQAFLPGLERLALEGATAAALELQAAGIAIDWTLVNIAASEWARKYSFKLVNGITKTSRKALQAQLAAWVESGEPLPELTKRLSKVYGPVRGEMIAITEATRAYAEGNTMAWKESRVVKGRRWNTAYDDRVCLICGPLNDQVKPLGEPFDTDIGPIDNPPAHVRCRCWITPVVIGEKI